MNTQAPQQNRTEDFQTMPPLTIGYFFVAIDRDMRNYRLLQYPISPNFRTIEAAKAFQNAKAVPESYVIEAHTFIKDESERAISEDALFNASHLKAGGVA